MHVRKSSIEPTTKINSMYLWSGGSKMNDPEVMERIAEALERIAWLIGLQVGEEWFAMMILNARYVSALLSKVKRWKFTKDITSASYALSHWECKPIKIEKFP